MYFQIKDTISRIELQDIEMDTLTLGIISLEELEDCYQAFGFSEETVEDCRYDFHNSRGILDFYSDYMFGIIIGINAKQIIMEQDRIGLYIKKNLLLLVIIEDADNSIRNNLFGFLERLNLAKITQERLIFGFLERIISNDYVILEEIEKEISKYEDKINDRNYDGTFNYKITEIRKKLLLLDNFYQQLIAIGEELEENSADIFNEDNLRYFKIFVSRATRLSNNTRALQDYSVHVRDAYHAQLDLSLNGIMKLFTVVTTIFLPLTLITSWYGMNFTTMPELAWKYGYIYVMIFTLIIAVICILFFKKKRFF